MILYLGLEQIELGEADARGFRQTTLETATSLHREAHSAWLPSLRYPGGSTYMIRNLDVEDRRDGAAWVRLELETYVAPPRIAP